MNTQQNSMSAVRRLIVSEILIVVVILLSLAAFRLLYAQKPVVEERASDIVLLNVDVFEANPVDVEELLTGFGTVQADREVVLSAQVAGEIVEIHPQLKVGYAVNAGDAVSSPERPSVRRGADLLLKIDQRDYSEQVTQATSRIDEAQTEIDRLKVQQENVRRQLDKARAVLKTLNEELDRTRRGVEKRVSTPAELNRALLDVQRYEDTVIQLESQAATLPHQLDAAAQRLSSSRSEKLRAENDFQRTEVVPPFNGVLSEIFVEQGQFVRAGEQLVRLTDLAKVEVPVSLSLDDFLRLERDLAEGNRPSVALAENETAEPQWSGYLVRSAPEADPQSRTVQVFVEVFNMENSAPLLPGTFVHARINGPQHASALLIPREAVIDGSVFVVDQDNIVRQRPITTGRRYQSLVAVEEGVQPGDRIVLTNLDIVENEKEVVVQRSSGPLEEMASLRSPVIRPTTVVD